MVTKDRSETQDANRLRHSWVRDVLELHEGHDWTEDLFLRDLHVLLANPSEHALVTSILPNCSVLVESTYRDVDENGGLDVVPFGGGGLAAGEQRRALALAVLDVLEDLLKLFLVNLAAQRTMPFRCFCQST